MNPGHLLAWIAFLCIVGTQVVFWTFTYPVNRMTANWTFLPGDWWELRKRWEYSHAASAVLNLIALIALIACMLWMNDGRALDIDAARHGYAGVSDRPPQYWRDFESTYDATPPRDDARYI